MQDNYYHLGGENKFDITKFDIDFQELYNEAINNPEFTNIVKDLLDPNIKFIDERVERQYPRIFGLDDNGLPTLDKPKRLLERVLGGNAYIILLEGGVRGGKDVWALWAWSQYLMVCPETHHLALGKSLEHALMTILHSNGFGLLYLIPNGVFERISDRGAQRGVFRFTDAYGRNKEILFYGNDKANDFEKFQGFTIGSTYANEGTNQHIKGLFQALDRMASTKRHLMIITQNPKGEAEPYYMDFEKDKLYSIEEIEYLESLRDIYKDDFMILENKIYNGFDKLDIKEFERIKEKYKELLGDDFENKFRYKAHTDGTFKIFSDREIANVKVRNDFYAKIGVPKNSSGYSFLNDVQKQQLRILLYDTQLAYDRLVRSLLVKDFQKDLPAGHKFENISMKKVVHYDRGGDNPNHILNAIDYDYFHFTIEDNLSMNFQEREEFKRSKGVPGTANYDRSVEGIRRSAEGALFSNFMMTTGDDGNLLDGAVSDYDNNGWERVISIDFGMNHFTGMVDADVNLTTGEVHVLGERLLDLKDDDNKDMEYIYQQYLLLVRERKGRRMPTWTIADPSNTALIRYFKTKGVLVQRADNSTFQARGKDKTFSHKIQEKGQIGLDLLQTAVGLRKLKIHVSCHNTIKQVNSYEVYFDEKSGKIKVNKINDEQVDNLKYIFNKFIKPQIMWVNDNSKVKKGENLNDKKPKENEQTLAIRIQEAINELEEADNIYRSRYEINGSFFD